MRRALSWVANQSCPKKQLVKITEDKSVVLESVYCKFDLAVFERRSVGLLDNVAAVLTAHPELKIQVEGHTDSKGDDGYNRKLSQRRAESVVTYLTQKGIAADRLTSFGYGEDRPIADNATTEGRAQNRRVVFTVIGGPGNVKTRLQGARRHEGAVHPRADAEVEVPWRQRRVLSRVRTRC